MQLSHQEDRSALIYSIHYFINIKSLSDNKSQWRKKEKFKILTCQRKVHRKANGRSVSVERTLEQVCLRQTFLEKSSLNETSVSNVKTV